MPAPSSWRDRILSEFTPGLARLTLAADPDGLLTEAGVLQELRERGFDVLLYKDPVAFRFAYETGFRSRWEAGDAPELVVVVPREAAALASLPYDLLQAGRSLSFSLTVLFPELSYPVVRALDAADLETLYQAQARERPRALGDNATRDFILRHVFDLFPGTVRNEVELLRLLLRQHYRARPLPTCLQERVVQILRAAGPKPWPRATPSRIGHPPEATAWLNFRTQWMLPSPPGLARGTTGCTTSRPTRRRWSTTSRVTSRAGGMTAKSAWRCSSWTGFRSTSG
jgi:hypothetical protein